MNGPLTRPALLARLWAIPAVRWRAALLVALAAGLTVVTARYVAKAEKPSRLGEQTRTAFLRWRNQIQGLESGTDIYRAFNYPNPPIQALVLWPLTELPPLTGALVWFYLKVLMAALAVRWVLRMVVGRAAAPATESRPTFPPWAQTLAVLLSLHPILGDLSHGNVNLFIAFLVIAALELFRRRRDFAAGVVLALAVACKVTPALFLPYFVWKRAWRLVAGAGVGLGLWLAVVPGAVLGWEYNRTLLTSWFDRMVKPFVLDGKVTSEHPNQSVPGVVYRLLTAEPSFLEYDEGDGRPVAAGFHNVADVGAGNAKLLVKGLMALFAMAVVLLCRWPTRGEQPPRAGPWLAAEFALIALGMLLFSERTWKHHAVTLILPNAVIVYAVAARLVGPAARLWLVGTLVLTTTLTLGPSLVGGRLQDLAMVWGTYTAAWALLAVGVGLVLAARPQSR